jgi:CubicO group peptidase (beta-lactamase class C family)
MRSVSASRVASLHWLLAALILLVLVGKPLGDYLAERIWKPAGMEADATWWLASPDGMEIAGSGFSATLRDYARFGLFFLNGGQIDGQAVLPTGWMEEAGSPKRSTSGGTKPNRGCF